MSIPPHDKPHRPMASQSCAPASGEAAAGFWLLAHQISQRSETERLNTIQNGFAPAWVKAVKEALKLENGDLEALLNSSISTLERRQRREQPLDRVASERLDRVAMIAIHALRLFETPERAGLWMQTANKALAGQKPLSLSETDIGARQVHRALAALEHGGPA